MKVFLTGASGKIGQKLLAYLLKKKIYCYGNSRKKIKNKYKNFFYSAYNKSILDKSFEIKKDCEVFIHAATNTSEKKNFTGISVNKKIDKKIFKLIKKHPKIKKLIFISTVAIYSKKNLHQLNENVKKLDNSIYSKIKFHSEKMFSSLKKIKVYNLRIPGTLCTGKENNFLSNMVSNIKKKQMINYYNPNNSFNNVILVEKLNQFIYQLIKNDYKSGTILLGSSSPIKIKSIVHLIESFYKIKIKINWIYKKEGFFLNISNAINNYNYKPYKTKYSIIKYLKTENNKYI